MISKNIITGKGDNSIFSRTRSVSENIRVVSFTGDDIFQYHNGENKFSFYFMHFDEKAGILTIFTDARETNVRKQTDVNGCANVTR